MSPRRGPLGLAFTIAIALGAVAACGKKATHGPPPEVVAGLAAVPASAQVVLVADVGRVADSPLVGRAVDQLLVRDADLAARWERLQAHCHLGIDQLRHVVLAIGPARDRPGTGPVLMVATGKLVETDFAACVRAMVGEGGGTLTAKAAGGRTLYAAQDHNRTMYFVFGKPDTVILGSDEAYVREALAPGKKVLDSPELGRWLRLSNQRAPLWGAGKVDDRVREGLVRVTQGKLAAGPRAIVVSFDPTQGATVEVGAVMASAADAKTLESFAKSQLALLGMAAQARSLGPLVAKIQISASDDTVRFRVALDVAEINQLISVLDAGGVPAQDSPPTAGSGSAAEGK